MVSQGPSPIQVPDVIGLTEERAKNLLTGANFAMVVTVEYGRSNDVGKGEVYATDPASESDSTRTAPITLYVSEGKLKVGIPDVRGKEFADAKAQLEALGFVVKGKNDPWNYSTVVYKTGPAAGEEVEDGSTINVEY